MAKKHWNDPTPLDPWLEWPAYWMLWGMPIICLLFILAIFKIISILPSLEEIDNFFSNLTYHAQTNREYEDPSRQASQ